MLIIRIHHTGTYGKNVAPCRKVVSLPFAERTVHKKLREHILSLFFVGQEMATAATFFTTGACERYVLFLLFLWVTDKNGPIITQHSIHLRIRPLYRYIIVVGVIVDPVPIKNPKKTRGKNIFVFSCHHNTKT
jgi:hypothetical protein